MNAPADLKYTREHEWVKIEGEKVYVGITDYAQHTLGDIVFAELPEIGKVIKAGEILGVVESVKAVSDVYCPLSGKVVEINRELIDAPEKINEEPYENWMAALEITDQDEIGQLLSNEQYVQLCAGED